MYLQATTPGHFHFGQVAQNGTNAIHTYNRYPPRYDKQFLYYYPTSNDWRYISMAEMCSSMNNANLSNYAVNPL